MFEEGAGELIQEMESQRVKTDSTLTVYPPPYSTGQDTISCNYKEVTARRTKYGTIYKLHMWKASVFLQKSETHERKRPTASAM